MSNIEYHIVRPDDKRSLTIIAHWYLREWNIPTQTTITKIEKLSEKNDEFHVLMTLENEPIATGGIRNHVALLEREPRFSMYKNWLALVYTEPTSRGKGLGSLLCHYIQERSKQIGLNDIYLFTHTAENLYQRLGWQPLERITLTGKNIVVMKKEL